MVPLHTLGFLLKTLFNYLIIPTPCLPILIVCCLFYYLTVVTGNSVCTTESKDTSCRGVPKQYCNYCSHRQYYRMKHCQICNKCIHKYDHHCFLLNTCIGQFNHKHYIGLLASYSLTQGMTMYQSVLSLPELASIDNRGIEHYQYKYYALVMGVFYSLAAIVICCRLLSRHVRLILHNSTNWEEHRRERITYMVVFDSEYPFSKGYCANIMETLRARRESPIEWELMKGV